MLDKAGKSVAEANTRAARLGLRIDDSNISQIMLELLAEESEFKSTQAAKALRRH